MRAIWFNVYYLLLLNLTPPWRCQSGCARVNLIKVQQSTGVANPERGANEQGGRRNESGVIVFPFIFIPMNVLVYRTGVENKSVLATLDIESSARVINNMIIQSATVKWTF